MRFWLYKKVEVHFAYEEKFTYHFVEVLFLWWKLCHKFTVSQSRKNSISIYTHKINSYVVYLFFAMEKFSYLFLKSSLFLG
jgi:hypothetical protein